MDSSESLSIQRLVPDGPGKTTTICEVYRRQGSTDDVFRSTVEARKKTSTQQKAECESKQKTLSKGVLINGEVHPETQQGSSLHFQTSIRKDVQSHYKREQAAKREVAPAQPKLPHDAIVSEEDVDFCSSLACDTKQQGLVW
jgi:hypothetical protein